MTRNEALVRLRTTRNLTTGLLEPLGIGFDSWLQFAQLPIARQAEIVEQLIARLEAADEV